MACVHNFLAGMAGEVVDDLEEQFLRTVLRAPGVSGRDPEQQYSEALRRYEYGIARWGRTRNGYPNPVRRHPRRPQVDLARPV